MSLPWAEPFAAALALRDEPGLVLLESMPGFGDARPALVPRRAARGGRAPTGSPTSSASATAGGRAGSPTTSGARSSALPVARRRRPRPAAAGARPLRGLARVRPRAPHGRSSAATATRAHLLRALARPRDRRHRRTAPVERWDSSLPRARYEQRGRSARSTTSARATSSRSTSRSGSARLGRRSVRALRAPARDEPGAVRGARAARRRGRDLGLAGALPAPCAATAIETRPIKGTRPRGADRAPRTAAARSRLRASAKDRAENVMIVDLARNDLGRVARYGTVAVERLCALECHPGRAPPRLRPSSARLRPRVSARPTSCGRPSRPARSRARPRCARSRSSRSSSRCGAAPTAARSAGSAPGGDLELSVAIRTFVAARERLHLHVGGAVTADSDPRGEWRETMHKAARLLDGRRRRVWREAGRDGARARLVKVWLNGALVDEERGAASSPSDHGFLVGDGVFETLRCYARRAVRARRASRAARATGARTLGHRAAARDGARARPRTR